MDKLNIHYNKINLKEEIRKIFKYLRDTGEFPYDAPKVVFRKGDAQNSQVDAQNINLPTAHYDPNNDTIVILIYDGRFLRDFCISFLHELSHVKQNRENRLGNIQTDNVTEEGYLIYTVDSQALTIYLFPAIVELNDKITAIEERLNKAGL